MIPHAMRVLKMYILSKLEILKVRTTLGILCLPITHGGPRKCKKLDFILKRAFFINNFLIFFQAPGTAPVFSPCGVNGGNPRGCLAGKDLRPKGSRLEVVSLKVQTYWIYALYEPKNYPTFSTSLKKSTC